MRRIFSLIVGTIVTCAAVAYLCVALPQAVIEPQDFRAFYCSGSVVATGQDPYLAVPLGECEDRLIREKGKSPLAGLVVPAPLPGYGFPVFVALSRLPFPTALGIFSLGILVSYVASGIVLQKMTSLPSWTIAASLWLSGGLTSLTNGQIVAYAFAAICFAAFEAGRGHGRRAALYALGTAIEPHIGIPVLLSLVVSMPRTRKPIALGSVLLAALAIGTIGIGRCVEYFTRVLPAQTQSEIHSSDQYSLTAFLHALGTPDGAALLAGDAQYALMVLLSVACARALSQATQKRELIVTLPAAFALIGGPYIHLVHMVVAIPLILTLVTLPTIRKPAALALLLIAVPWRDIVLNEIPFAALAIALTTIVLSVQLLSRRPLVVTLICTAMLVIGGIDNMLLQFYAHPLWDAVRGAAARTSHALAEQPWRIFIETIGEYQTPNMFLATHTPTWIGLIVMAATALALVRSGTRTNRDLAPSVATNPA